MPQPRSSTDWLREGREVIVQTLQHLKMQPDAYMHDERVHAVVDLSRQIVEVAEADG